jgi:hypothetical protein
VNNEKLLTEDGDARERSVVSEWLPVFPPVEADPLLHVLAGAGRDLRPRTRALT